MRRRRRLSLRKEPGQRDQFVRRPPLLYIAVEFVTGDRKRCILVVVDDEHTQGGAIECGAALGPRAGSAAKKS